ncbi:PA2778 family cysteine peptidase [Zobellella maritima]|uniref:PA2778 family cysteine peptidase n=1 Tax=Zobellella maritima TaxID=2059725 RepID=UPI0018E5199D|nr:PA2778 family cysteine peptidase [Zobellella maritima]
MQSVRLAGVLPFLLMILLAGCSSPRPSAEVAGRLPDNAYIAGVPFHGQRDYQCGPASLAMLLNASGVRVDVEQLISQVFVPGRSGSVQPEMLATARRHGRISYPLTGSLDTLLTEVAAGHPVLVLQNLSLPLWPLWHYAVVIGYDQERTRLLLHSGEQSHQPVAMGRFDATWARSDRWAMVALPPGQLPESITPQLATESIAAFETVAGSESALPAWQSLVTRWPTHAMGWFALGNALYATDKPQAAIDAFHRATEQAPALAVAWLNLGLAQAALDQRQAATYSLGRAAALPGQWQSHARQAQQQLEQN